MQTIRFRLTLAYAALLLCTLVGLSGALYAAMSHALAAAARDAVVSLSDQAVRLVEAGSTEGESQGIGIDLNDPTLSETLARGGLYLEVRAPDGKVLSRSTSLHGRPLVDSHLARVRAGPQSSVEDIAGLGQVLTQVTPVNVGHRYLGIVVAGQSLADTNDALARLRALLVAGGALALVIAVLGGWWLAGAALQPVDRLTRAAISISAGALSQRLRLRGPDDELHRLAAAFDDMLERLERAFERERQFTANVAHELKTPLTILHGEIDVAMRRPREPDDYKRALQSLNEEVGRLTRLVDNLLTIARMDSGKATMRKDAFHIETFVRGIAQRFDERAARNGVALNLLGRDDVAIDADPDQLMQSVDNLIDNALRHTHAGGTIEIRWLEEHGGVAIEVADTGDGIPAEHLPHIFQRFYRVDSHRSRDAGGAGLGLAITKQIIEAHEGTITVASRTGGGSIFTIRIPTRASTSASLLRFD